MLPAAGNDMNVAGAWAAGFSGRGIKVAVVDSGLEIAHEDLAANVDAASSFNFLTGGNDPTPDTLWGSYNYTPDKDVVRVPMTVSKSQASIDQLTWGFCDVTTEGGKMFVTWDTSNAMVPFAVAK